MAEPGGFKCRSRARGFGREKNDAPRLIGEFNALDEVRNQLVEQLREGARLILQRTFDACGEEKAAALEFLQARGIALPFPGGARRPEQIIEECLSGCRTRVPGGSGEVKPIREACRRRTVQQERRNVNRPEARLQLETQDAFANVISHGPAAAAIADQNRFGSGRISGHGEARQALPAARRYSCAEVSGSNTQRV